MKFLSTLTAAVAALGMTAQSPYVLQADGKTDTYTLISNAGFFAETSGGMTPDEYMMHPDYHHISQVFDADLDDYVFAFDIHVDYDENGKTIIDGNQGELKDRQRNEIKCMSSVPATVAADGETITYSWLFKLPEGMLTTSAFCHVHQVKGMGSGPEVAHPVITFTCRSVGNGQQLQVINVPDEEEAESKYLARTDLKPLLGKWLHAEETFTVGEHGKYSVVITDVETDKEVISVKVDDIRLYRYTSDNSILRGKWGIYRSVGTDLSLVSQLRDERLFFADVEAIKDVDDQNVDDKEDNEDEENSGDEAEKDNQGSDDEGEDSGGSTSVETVIRDEAADGIYYDIQGRMVKHPAGGIYIYNGKKILMR